MIVSLAKNAPPTGIPPKINKLNWALLLTEGLSKELP